MLIAKKQLKSIKKFYKLSPLELKLLKLIFDGVHSNQEIAERLNLTLLTAKGILYRIYCKTGYHNKLTLAIKLLEQFTS